MMTLDRPLRILFALPGLHQVSRGAEVAFMNVAAELARAGHQVSLIGSGKPKRDTPYTFLSASSMSRERFERLPALPVMRNETVWEEASFIPSFLRTYRPQNFDVTLTCAYPFLNWTLRSRKHKGRRPAHVFVTQNGDWAARANNSEYRYFGCDGLVCINPDYFEAHQGTYRSALIPNGVDLSRFHPGPSMRPALGWPTDAPVVLMVSALIESKQVAAGIEAVSRLPGVHLIVLGDGPLRDALRAQAERQMPGRYHNFTTTPDQMPDVYRSADVFLHLSREESFGNVFVEAMASGLPVVAWDMPRTRWITGDAANLVPGTNVAAVSDELATALAKPAGSTNLVARAERFAWSRIAADYADFLSDVVGARRLSGEQ